MAGFVPGMGQIIEAGLDLCLRIYKIVPVWYLRLVYARISATPLKICETEYSIT